MLHEVFCRVVVVFNVCEIVSLVQSVVHVKLGDAFAMMSAANGLSEKVRYIKNNQLLRKSQLFFTHSRTVSDNNGINAFTSFHIFEAVFAKET